ncbi:MAG: gamma-glutamyl-gamma-aminobutyrate hydrolase family protein [Bacteriovoracaceae bacterium]|nr:gamma-glutamyl-gamma-aminobutyrate hydrolase family protein [Bacteriovoracaceae bacterium]
MRYVLFLSFIFFGISSATFGKESLSIGKLIIGCTTKCSFFYERALKRISKLNRIPITIIDLSKNPELELSEVDGIVIPGGADINPQYYLPYVEDELQRYTRGLDHLVNYSSEGERRDPFEYGLLKKYFNDQSLYDLPVLGICRGMQMLAVSQGIPLYVDIKTELGIRNRRYLYDRINVKDHDSLMKELFPALTFLGFEQHHQGIRVDYYKKHHTRWPNVKVTSYSNKDLIAESMEFTDRPVLGVQFHPEKDFGNERRSIFGWFLNKAKSRKSGKF